MKANKTNSTESVYSQVTAKLEGQDVRELWHQLRSELLRKDGGPEACVAHLQSELTRIQGNVRRALDWVGKA